MINKTIDPSQASMSNWKPVDDGNLEFLELNFQETIQTNSPSKKKEKMKNGRIFCKAFFTEKTHNLHSQNHRNNRLRTSRETTVAVAESAKKNGMQTIHRVRKIEFEMKIFPNSTKKNERKMHFLVRFEFCCSNNNASTSNTPERSISG